FTVYTDRTDWLDAVASSLDEDFDDATLNVGISVVSDMGGIGGGVWNDVLNNQMNWETTWTFDPPIYAFGGYWDLTPAGVGGLVNVLIGGGVFADVISPAGGAGFWGVVSDEPFAEVLLGCAGASNPQETYTLDDMVYSIEPPVIEVAIDIKPGSFPNSINPDGKGVIPVAILTTSVADGDPVDFDASMVDASTVRFLGNCGGASMAHKKADLEDVDSDGDIDMVLHFRIQEAHIFASDTEACLEGQTMDGAHFVGCDSIRVVPKD
ncbi:MAG: hypothetical protein JSW34_13460, partial [Candidatus Zixiibacteriota bacterium]